MIKLYITAIESKEDGTAVTLFEGYELGFKDKDTLICIANTLSLNEKIHSKIEYVEKINNQQSTPF